MINKTFSTSNLQFVVDIIFIAAKCFQGHFKNSEAFS